MPEKPKAIKECVLVVREHLDISLGKKRLAIQFGAKEISQRELLVKMKEQANAH